MAYVESKNGFQVGDWERYLGLCVREVSSRVLQKMQIHSDGRNVSVCKLLTKSDDEGLL